MVSLNRYQTKGNSVDQQILIFERYMKKMLLRIKEEESPRYLRMQWISKHRVGKNELFNLSCVAVKTLC